MANFQILTPRSLGTALGAEQHFAHDVLLGLSQAPKRLPSKYFYDARGFELFQRITTLPEYYPTACEAEIFREHKEQIVRFVGGEPFRLVELGAGDGSKTNLLLAHLLERNVDFRYVPIDISQRAMEIQCRMLEARFPELPVEGLVSDFFLALHWLNDRDESLRNFVLFLGSTIGNFTPAGVRVFLRNLWYALNDGDLVLIGFDLRKDIDLLMRAYNDSAGVTAAFNLNLLARINRELGGTFDLATFRHRGTYNFVSGAMESYLISEKAQSVFIESLSASFDFAPWEAIHTESSQKYLLSEIEALAAETGFVVETHLFDRRRYFTDSIWRVVKRGGG